MKWIKLLHQQKTIATTKLYLYSNMAKFFLDDTERLAYCYADVWQNYACSPIRKHWENMTDRPYIALFRHYLFSKIQLYISINAINMLVRF